MHAQLEDEDSADEEFWNQDAFAEESGDDAYESEEEEGGCSTPTSTRTSRRREESEGEARAKERTRRTDEGAGEEGESAGRGAREGGDRLVAAASPVS